MPSDRTCRLWPSAVSRDTAPSFRSARHHWTVRGRHRSVDGRGFASDGTSQLPRHGWNRFLDGLRHNFRLALSAFVFTLIGVFGVFAWDEPLKMSMCLVGGLAQWALVYWLGSNKPWPGD